MGCDIHVCCEFKNNKGEWINCDHFKINPYYRPEYIESGEQEWEIIPIYDDRNYSLFATLANVRNYGGTTVISEARGLPDDIHPLTKKIVDDWGCDGHTHSYYTLRELLDYMSTGPITTYSGLITIEQAKDLDNFNIYPESWRQGTNMKGYVRRTWTMPDGNLNKLITAMKKRCAEVFWIFEWSKDYENKIKCEADNFRIVFWFDN